LRGASFVLSRPTAHTADVAGAIDSTIGISDAGGWCRRGLPTADSTSTAPLIYDYRRRIGLPSSAGAMTVLAQAGPGGDFPQPCHAGLRAVDGAVTLRAGYRSQIARFFCRPALAQKYGDLRKSLQAANRRRARHNAAGQRSWILTSSIGRAGSAAERTM